VGQRLAEQGEVAEGDPYLVLQLLDTTRRNLGILDGAATATTRASLAYEADLSCMYSQAWPTVVILSASSSGISRPVFSSNA
jgi:hypothetical protein